MSTFMPAKAINRTIDDTYGDSETGALPIYSPVDAWDGVDCIGCAINPDPDKAHDGSYYAATYNEGMEPLNIFFSFEGTALYVYFILANDEGVGITTTTAVNFTLDGIPDGEFTHIPLDTERLQYNELVYYREGLDQEWHDFLISTSGVPGDVFVNFDYAIYTYEEEPSPVMTWTGLRSIEYIDTTLRSRATEAKTWTPMSTTDPSDITPSSSTSGHTSIIVGVAVGCGLVLSILGALGCFCLSRRLRKHSRSLGSAESYEHVSGTSLERTVPMEKIPFDGLQMRKMDDCPVSEVSRWSLNSSVIMQSAQKTQHKLKKPDATKRPASSRASFTQTSRSSIPAAAALSAPSSVAHSRLSVMGMRHQRQHALRKQIVKIQHDIATLPN